MGRKNEADWNPQMTTPYSEPMSGEEFLVAVAGAAMQGGQRDPRLRWSSAAGANEAIPSEGGFGAPTEVALDLLEGIEEYATLYPLVDRQPIARGNTLKLPTIDERSRVTGSRLGGLQMYWVDEAAQVQATMPKYRSVEHRLEKLMGVSGATNELSDDVTALRAILNRSFKLEAATMVDEAIIAGTGVGQPLGILNSGALIRVEPESGQAAATVTAENIVKMWARCWAPGQKSAMWIYHQELAPQLFNLASNGSPLVTFTSDGPFMMGRPLVAHGMQSARSARRYHVGHGQSVHHR